MADSSEHFASPGVFAASFYHCAVGMAHVDLDGRFIRVNPRLCEFLGYSEDVLQQLTFQEITAGPFLKKDESNLHDLLEGRTDSYSMEKQYVHASGRAIWGKLTVSLVRDSDEKPEYLISVVEDIDEKKCIESRLSDTESLFKHIVSSFSHRTFVWVANSDLSRILYVNDGYQTIWGRSPLELFEQPLAFLNHVHEEDRARVEQELRQPGLREWGLEYRVITRSGSTRYIHDRGTTIYDSEGNAQFLIGTADDVSDDKSMYHALLAANKKLKVMSRTDGLTGILNRRELLYQIDKEIQRIHRGDFSSTLLFIDLNEFKSINDRYGHRAGDDALVTFAAKINTLLRETDSFGRYGGDEFVVLLHNADEQNARSFHRRLLAEPLTLMVGPGADIEITFSVGISAWRANCKSAQIWVEQADDDMYCEKRKRSAARIS
ncbi:diguanylate cyclase [Alteromonas halophila]|uniref:diguanylate cyclase n=1 Tax=Alteromonas halophila TaxID=516698 RepID=UPI001E2872D5|nr:diguanylate cyclase [Alteromonas halophila]